MESIADSSKVKSAGKPPVRSSKGAAQKTAPPKQVFTPKDREQQTGKVKSTKTAPKEGKPQTGKKDAKSWKRENAAQKSAHARAGKNAGKEKKSHDSKKGKHTGAEGSFKNYRKRGRR
jgi:23S rRNA pseudouridine2604 synthase